MFCLSKSVGCADMASVFGSSGDERTVDLTVDDFVGCDGGRGVDEGHADFVVVGGVGHGGEVGEVDGGVVVDLFEGARGVKGAGLSGGLLVGNGGCLRTLWSCVSFVASKEENVKRRVSRDAG